MEGRYKIYICYDSNRLEWLCYDPDGAQWIDVPTQPEFSVFVHKALAVGTELLVFGRRNYNLDVIHKFSILNNSWSLGGEMKEPRCWFGSASLGEIAIVAGGLDPKNYILSSAEIYNSNTGTWESLPRMNRQRGMCSGVFMDGNFYVVGGIGVDYVSLRCGEMFDLEKKKWHVIPNMLPARCSTYERRLPLLAVVKNELYAAFHWENEVMKYDKGMNLWSTVGSLPEELLLCPAHWSRTGTSGMVAFSAYRDQLIVIVGRVRQMDLDEPGWIKVYEWVPDKVPLQWNFLAFNYDEPGQEYFRSLSAVIARE